MSETEQRVTKGGRTRPFTVAVPPVQQPAQGPLQAPEQAAMPAAPERKAEADGAAKG